MPQINKGDTFANGEQVTGARLNQLIDSATILPSIITEQTSLTNSATTDSLLVYRLASTSLRRTTVGDFFASNTPIVCSSISSASDIVITPTDGTAVTLKAYASVDGITTTVTSTAHGLITGQIVTITSASNVSYNGTYRITVTGVDTFTYLTSSVLGALSGTGTSINNQTTGTVTSTAHGLTTGMLVKVQVYYVSTGVLEPIWSVASATVTVTSVNTFTYTYSSNGTSNVANNAVWTSLTPAPSTGTLTYQRKGVEKIVGNKIINGNNYTDGTVFANGANVNGNLIATGNIKTSSLNTTGDISTDGNIYTKTLQVSPRFDYFVQTRTSGSYNYTWGGIQNNSNLYGTEIAPLTITLTPKKAGNTLILTFDVSGESNISADSVWVVTRTPNSGTGSGVAVALPNSVDDSNNTWSGITNGNYDVDASTTLNKLTIKIIDFNTLNVSCTYRLHIRASYNANGTFFFNRTVSANGGLNNETGLSITHAQEIYV